MKRGNKLFRIILALSAFLFLAGIASAAPYGSAPYGSGSYGTGAATGVYGYANVTVLATTDIEMIRDTVNFTNANPGDTRVSTVASDVDDGSTCDPYCGLLIANNGSVEVNISITNAERLFDGGSYNAAAHYL
jgi:hypothetical protein